MGVICNKDKKAKNDIKLSNTPGKNQDKDESNKYSFVFYKKTVNLNKKILIEKERDTVYYISKNERNYERWNKIINNNITISNGSSIKAKKNTVVPNLYFTINETYSFKDDIINGIILKLKKRFKLDKDSYNKLLFKSPPNQIRFLSWLAIALNNIEFHAEKDYNNLLIEILPEAEFKQIQMDLERTAPDIPFFQNKIGIDSLFSVLKAVAIFDKDVGYCQGMNILVANMLLVSDGNELNTFNVIKYIFSLKGLRIREFFVSGFPRLNMYLYIIKEILKDQKKVIYDKINELQVPDEIWIFKWMQSLFALVLPLEVIVRIWDCIFAFGIEFSLNIIIALVDIYEKDILKVTDLDEFCTVFKMKFSDEAEIINFREKLISTAKSIVIKETTFYNLKLMYDKIKNTKVENHDNNSSSTEIECGNKGYFDHNVEIIKFQEKINFINGNIQIIDNNNDLGYNDSIINEEDIHFIDDSKNLENYNNDEKKNINLIQSSKKNVLVDYFKK